MADYIYLLSTRLTQAQQTAIESVREAARAHGMTVFLVGGAVRDLTSGSPIRDLDIAVQGNAMDLKDEISRWGGLLIGEDAASQSLYFNFPRGVRMEVESTLSATYPQPGHPEYSPAGILDDLRRRDFTANAMAISLNDGSYGLLMDPLNGVADIENRELRLVSNYGFIEDPARLIRAARFSARFGWQMEEKTLQRYENGKAEGYINTLSPAHAGYELEEIFHEEDPLRVLHRLETEGWAKTLSPVWTSAKANEAELNRLRDLVGQLEAMGIHPDPSPAYFPLLTAKLNPKEVTALKSSFARQGFVDQIAALEGDTKALAAQFSSKAAAAPSDAWKMLFASAPEPVLWLAHTSRSAPVQAKFKAFFNDWSQARQKIPYQLMQEMRITPDLPGYSELIEQLFFAIMDAKLETAEAAKAFLEPFSPPAPPPPPNLRRRPVKRESKAAKPRSKKAAAGEAVEAHAAADAVEPVSAETGGAPSAAVKQGSTKTATPAAAASANKGVARGDTKSESKTGARASAPGTTSGKGTSSPEQPSGPAARQPAARQPAKAPAKPQVESTTSKPAAKPASQAPAKSAAKPSSTAAKAPAKAVAVPVAVKKSAHAPAKAAKKTIGTAKKATAAHAGTAKPAGKSQAGPSKVKAGSKAAKGTKPAPAKAAAHKSASKPHSAVPSKAKSAGKAAQPGTKGAAKGVSKTASKSPAKSAGHAPAKRRH